MLCTGYWNPPGPTGGRSDQFQFSGGPPGQFWRVLWRGTRTSPWRVRCATCARLQAHEQVRRLSARAIRIPFVRRNFIEVQASLHPLAGTSQFFFPAHHSINHQAVHHRYR